MKRILTLYLIMFLILPMAVLAAHNDDHVWHSGKILDQNRARYFAGMIHNSSSSTSSNGSFDATANSSTYGGSTSTNINGSYSGTSTTSTTGTSTAVYRVYDYLTIEGDDAVYFTSERLVWRWSKGAHVSVNGTVKYYIEGRKIHLIDEDGKERSIEIVKTIIKPSTTHSVNVVAPAAATPQQPVSTKSSEMATIAIDASVSAADIEVDGDFVGNTPSTITLTAGKHTIVVKKKGYADWTRTVSVSTGNIHLNADMDAIPVQTSH